MALTAWKKWKKYALATAISASMIVSAGCSGGASAPEAGDQDRTAAEAAASKRAVVLFHVKSSTLDPADNIITVKAGIAETLTRLDADLGVKPWLAASWTAVDASRWEFLIRDNVTFQDGSPLTAEAVKASLERTMARNESMKLALKIRSMTAEGQKLAVETLEPHPALASELLNPHTAIIQVKEEASIASAPVGTGPFRVASFAQDARIELERHDGYWDGAAKLEQVSFRFNEDGNVRALALQSGEADIATQLPAESVEAIRLNPKLKVESEPGLRVHFLLFNPQGEATGDLRVRQAFDVLLDRRSIVEDIMLGHAAPANGPFNDRLPFGRTAAAAEQDLDKAKQLLEQAGYAPDASGSLVKDGKKLTLKLLTYKARPELPLIAQLLQSDAAKIGIAIDIRTVENIDDTIRQNRDWDLVTYSNLSAPRGDGGFFLNSALMPGGSLNAADIRIDELTDVMKTLNATSEAERRIALTREAVDIAMSRTPHAYAVYPNLIVGLNERIVGWRTDPSEYTILTNELDVS